MAKSEWIAGALITLAALWLHVSFLLHAGGLWRDESGVVRLATLPAASEMWTRLGHESCPVLFPAAIRAWSALGLGATDSGLRVYGLIAGALMLGACWLNGRWLTRSAPLLSLALLASSAAVVRWGDSLRAYGTGTVLLLLLPGLVWRFVEDTARGRWLAAAAAALLSVQCLFQNTCFVLGVCVAGAVLCWRRRQAKRAAAALAIGIPAALSLLLYLPVIRQARDWAVLSDIGFRPGWVWRNIAAAFNLGPSWTHWIWIGLLALAVGRWAWLLARRAPAGRGDATAVSFYAGTALLAGTAAFFVFLWMSGLPTQVWYYLPLLAFAAACVEGMLANPADRHRAGRAVFAGLVIALGFPAATGTVRHRQTNMDLIATELRDRVEPGDLIVVCPWYYGISFDRYYHGAAPWVTVPPLEDHRFHRYDLVKLRMREPEPLQPVLDRIAATLQSGHRIWIVGAIPLDGRPLLQWNAARRHFDEFYYSNWGRQAGLFLVAHGNTANLITPPSSGVSGLENVPLVSVFGSK